MLLEKQNDLQFPFIDNRGVSHDSIGDWIFVSLLGGCGCGSGESLGEKCVELIKYYQTGHLEREEKFGSLIAYEGEYHVLAHWMDNKEIVEHGGSVGGGWLTEFGKEIYETIKKLEN